MIIIFTVIWPQTVETVWGLKTILQQVTSLRSSHDSEWSRPKYSQLGLTHHQRRKWILLTPVDHGLTDLVWLDQRCQSILFHHLFSFFFFFFRTAFYQAVRTVGGCDGQRRVDRKEQFSPLLYFLGSYLCLTFFFCLTQNAPHSMSLSLFLVHIVVHLCSLCKRTRPQFTWLEPHVEADQSLIFFWISWV